MHNNSIIGIGKVYHKSRFYEFTKFVDHDSSLLLTHVDDSHRVWNDIFGYLNFMYMQ
jgi:hypothetical protein